VPKEVGGGEGGGGGGGGGGGLDLKDYGVVVTAGWIFWNGANRSDSQLARLTARFFPFLTSHI